MKLSSNQSYLLDQFEGPLDLLWHLVSQQEIDIYEISLHQITEQYLKNYQEIISNNLDHGADFIAIASSLVWLKSKTLIPNHAQELELPAEELDPNFEVIHHLLDYCRFKQAAKTLSEREQQQSAFYLRGIDNEQEIKKKLGIDHLCLDDLAVLFKEILAKASPAKGTIHEETWRVSDKIKALRYALNANPAIPFRDIFTIDKSRDELIVTFLALLELMKMGELRVTYQNKQHIITTIKSSL